MNTIRRTLPMYRDMGHFIDDLFNPAKAGRRFLH